MKRWFFMLALPVLAAVQAYSQEIITADRYLEMVSQRYSAIRDFEAHIVIRSGNAEMPGTISFLSPAFLRIDFTRPANQVIVFNGEVLTVYLPEHRAILTQHVTPSRRQASAGAPSLALLRRNYVPSFVTGPEPVPLDAGSPEQVVKLRLARRAVSEGFREIILSIDPVAMMIRRMEGQTIAGGLVQFDLTNIRTNLGIPEMRFLYDAPGTAFNFTNFLFRDAE